jgi:hypothetical protein
MDADRAVQPLSADTSPEIERRQIEAWRTMSPAERPEAVAGLTQAAVAMTIAGLRQRFPDDDPATRSLRLAVLMLGPRLARLAHPDVDSRLGDGA